MSPAPRSLRVLEVIPKPLPFRRLDQLLALGTSCATCVSLVASCLRRCLAWRYWGSAISPPVSRFGGLESSSANQRSGNGRFRRTATVLELSRPKHSWAQGSRPRNSRTSWKKRVYHVCGMGWAASHVAVFGCLRPFSIAVCPPACGAGDLLNLAIASSAAPLGPVVRRGQAATPQTNECVPPSGGWARFRSARVLPLGLVALDPISGRRRVPLPRSTAVRKREIALRLTLS